MGRDGEDECGVVCGVKGDSSGEDGENEVEVGT